MTLTANQPIAAGYEPIPGYVLEAKLGEGGFGEVWRCDAPGGVKKAIKFVFGSTEQRRGQREQKSLDRIKGVKHPFLLSLERYEIVDDRLTIVTELADGSVEDLYEDARQHGKTGIDAKSLLGYLRETADALDYLHRDFQLQHLDIKPGNLLLVGGHIKVADFGLVKDLRDVTQSVVGGLTPVYAPPEVFDGRPSLHSDQYSLAVMYQEMLTGVRPFSGKTIAQLATQHIHSAPNLRSLPPHQRPILARALEKDPERRFGCCSDLIAALSQPAGSSPIAVASSPKKPDLMPALPVHDLGPIEDLVGNSPDGHSTAERTLVIAVGGMGGACVAELRRRAAAEHSTCKADWFSVHIDTDRDCLTSVERQIGGTGSGGHWPVPTPLGSPQSYRHGGASKFQTLSRRWIYNIPRDGRTGGMRPLGRLAMLDHADVIDAAVTRAYQSAAGETPGTDAAAATGQRLRIFLVGSLCGGTASGMLLDLAPRVRTLVDAAGGHDVEIVPLLSVGSFRSHPKHILGLPNSIAAATELQHYLRAGGSYPGDRGVNWPSVPAARNPLRGTYLLSDGEVGGQQVSAAATIIDYIWTSACGAGAWLESGRRQECEAQCTIGPTVRSVGVSRLDNIADTEDLSLAIAAARLRLVRWLGRPRHDAELSGHAEQMVQAAGLSISAAVAADRWWSSVGGRESMLRDFAKQLVPPDDESETWVDPHLSVAELAATYLAGRGLSGWTKERSAKISAGLNSAVGELLKGQRLSLADMQTVVAEVFQKIAGSVDPANSQTAPVTDDAEARLLDADGWSEQRFAAALETALQRAAIDATHQIRQQAQQVAARLQARIRDRARFIAAAIQSVVAADASDSGSTAMTAIDDNPWTKLPGEMADRFESIQRQLQLELGQRVMDLEVEPPPAPAFAGELLSVAVELSRAAIGDGKARRPGNSREVKSATQSGGDTSLAIGSTAQLTVGAGEHRFRSYETTEQGLQALPPVLLRCGGSTRRLVVCAGDGQIETITEQLRTAEVPGGSSSLNIALSFFQSPGIQPTLIQEASGIGMQPVLQLLSGGCGADPAGAVQRLHSRTDIAWN